jgi:hypothetical protein
MTSGFVEYEYESRREAVGWTEEVKVVVKKAKGKAKRKFPPPTWLPTRPDSGEILRANPRIELRCCERGSEREMKRIR